MCILIFLTKKEKKREGKENDKEICDYFYAATFSEITPLNSVSRHSSPLPIVSPRVLKHFHSPAYRPVIPSPSPLCESVSSRIRARSRKEAEKLGRMATTRSLSRKINAVLATNYVYILLLQLEIVNYYLVPRANN